MQALQISYGEDTDDDRVADVYRSANTVANWNNIISVNLSMLIRSEAVRHEYDPKTYACSPPLWVERCSGPYNDRRQRMMFTTTVALRNRAW